ncbi:hypothetical protein IBT47_23130 [Erwinia sp. S43]|uniref:hypothetical protein n=1 Tax=Erwinia sp. S43 TaxID=2769339 RepID=UPI00190D30D3|nr:hypothetical protein [Erwinia sp. S43]MBK0035185.1 hypothetical protein [Erwinia sp. S43]
MAKKKGELRDVKAGIAVLTSHTHHDKEFQDAVMGLIRTSPVLKPISEKSNMSLLPARLSVQGEIPTEDELKGVFSSSILSTVALVVPDITERGTPAYFPFHISSVTILSPPPIRNFQNRKKSLLLKA